MAKNLLEQINDPSDLRKLERGQLSQLAKELRRCIIEIVATKEGHLGASLGVVELTIALHYLFNTPEDKLVWDVGHQAYGHKLLTGRREIFETNRQLGGISGFPKMEESIYDAFGTGHSSTSLSAVLGMALASKLNGNLERQHIAVIGDASIASGMAFEALNHAGVTHANVLFILNDNAIGIDPSVGALKRYLTNVKKGVQRDENIFEALNFDYHGPVDGHDLEALLSILETLKSVEGPKLLHVITKKGKGLRQAEEDQVRYHAPGKFDAITGELNPKSERQEAPKFQDVFGHTLVELASKNEKIVGITPAMPTGSSLKYMMERFPERAFDVGIAEQHAVTLAAGMATQGQIVYCNVYSTFLQRAYDQVIHDVALQRIPVIFCLDRAGLVGEDGATHHGAFDIAYLRCIPNMTVYAPKDAVDLRNILYSAQLGIDGPLAIRYPRGRGQIMNWKKPFEKIPIGNAEKIVDGDGLAILATGRMVDVALEVAANFSGQVAVYYFGFIKPLDQTTLQEIYSDFKNIVTLEDGVKSGGFGSAVAEHACAHHYRGAIEILGLPDEFIEHGKVDELMEVAGLSVKQVTIKIGRILT